MNKAIPEEIGSSKGDRRGVVMSPYATGGGGVTFERKVAVQYLAHLLVGDGAIELGEGRCVERVFFQQAPDHPVDDLVVCAADINSEIQPLLMLGIAIRRMPKIVKSDVKAQKLIREFVRAMVHAPTDGREYRWSLVVAGPQEHARQIADLAGHARVQLDAPGFFADIGAPGKFSHAIRQRLNHLESLVERALTELNVAEVDPGLVQRHTWQLLAHLTVSMPRLESPDETDWSAVSNSLVPVARGGDIAGACQLRDRLLALASKYAPMAARVDRNKLRRDVHPLIELNTRRNERRWQYLVRLNGLAVKAVRAEIRDDGGARRMTLNRNDCTGKLVAKAADAPAVVVSGEPGVGKSALVLLGFSLVNEANPDNRQALVFNLRDVPKRPFKFECLLGCPLFTLLGELSAPQRTLIVDGADAVSEGRECTFRYLIDAAQKSDVKVVAITSCDGNQVVQDILKEHFGENVTEFVVPPLTDAEIDGVVETFTELRKLNANPRSRDLLRRLVVIDLLVRSGISGILLSDADAMREVWSRLVRQHGKRVRGTPDAREATLLKLADLALREVGDDERLNGINELDPTALDGLCRDGLLRKSLDNPFMIGLEFTHDEVRRYAVARLLLANRKPTEKLIAAGVPRWAFSAALLACQVLLEEDESPNWPLRGRFSRLQASFDALAEKGHIARWADVPGEALLTIANPGPVLQDAWSDLRDNDANGLKRLARLMDQRLRKKNGIVDIHSVEPIVELLLEDAFPWRMGTYAQDILRDWLHALVEANTAVGHSLRIRLRERLVDWCAKADHRLAEVQARASNPTSEEIEQRHVIRKKYPPSPLTFRNSRQKRPDIPIEITAPLILELLALLGPDLGSDGESILCRVAQGDPSMLAPAIEKLFTDRALTKYGQGLLAYLTEAYYLNDATDGDNRYENGVRRHDSRIVGAFPNYSWHFGPFFCMFMTDFRAGVAVLNRLLNHAARVRVQKLAGLHGNVDIYQTELGITGERRLYLGDGHVWRWYRGYAVGPYPCFSALRALERVCDLRVKDDAAIGEIVSILLDRCENLAMVGLVVGLLIRHVEDAGSLLDSYFTEPIIWEQEFVRCAREFLGNEIDTDVVVSPERRMWSLREAAIFMTVRANAERVAELHTLGERLVENAQQRFKSARINEAANSPSGGIESNEEQLVPVRAWASSLDRTRLRVQVVSGGLDVTVLPPEDVVQTMQESNEIRCHRLDLMARHFTLNNQAPAKPFKTDELEADISTARLLLANRSPESAQSDWDLPAMVVANALEAHFLHGTSLSEEALVFAADTVIRIGQGEAEESPYECESTFFEIGAYRSAARALPLLFLPRAAPLQATVSRSFEWVDSERIAVVSLKLARAVANEVRLFLARGLDHVWQAPCAEKGRCHHDIGWCLAKETMHDCVLGDIDIESRQRCVIKHEEPLRKLLANIDGESIVVFRINAAIRALAPAAMADICVSSQAHDLLLVLLSAQRRALIIRKSNAVDDYHSGMLISARALLTLAEKKGDSVICTHINAFAGSPVLLNALLNALSAAAEETESRAATAWRIWPKIVRHVLALKDQWNGVCPLASLLPNLAHKHAYIYREIQDVPIVWWEPCDMKSEVKLWLKCATGRTDIVDALIGFIHVLAHESQARTGLPWVATLVLANTDGIALRSTHLTDWLIKMRAFAEGADRLDTWQEVVDALVVSGVSRLASYSE